MKCEICNNNNALRRYSCDGTQLYIERTCDLCTGKLMENGFDIVLEPQHLVLLKTVIHNGPNYPILRHLPSFLLESKKSLDK